MPYSGITPTKFGWYGVSMPFRADRLHLHQGGPLKEVDWESPLPILDQEDFAKQGIDVTALVPGAAPVDALGSCSCNSGTAHLAERVTAGHPDKSAVLAEIGLSSTDAVADEEYAILLYHAVTDQTGNPAQEWPPTDCGSNGHFVLAELETQGLIAGQKTASGLHNVASLIQGGSVMIGGPWFREWMQTDSQGFVDGDGSVEALAAAVQSGVVGGHETLLVALERLVLSETGVIDAANSWYRVRNSWSTVFGEQGEYRVHLSTLEMLGSYLDFKQAVPLPEAA